MRPLPDGAPCGASGVASCGATCLAGACSAPADRSLTIDRLRVKRGADDMRITAKGRFATSALFNPLVGGVRLTLSGASGEALVEAQVGLPISTRVRPARSSSSSAGATTQHRSGCAAS